MAAYDSYNNIFYCRMPLTGKDERLRHINSEGVQNQNYLYCKDY